MTVGLLHALFAYQGRQVAAEELAERACTIEIERCGKPIGKQDQYIAAFGGIRDIRFGPGEEVVAEELGLLRGRTAGPPAADHALLHRHHPERGPDPGRAERERRGHPAAARPAARPGRASPSSGCGSGDVDAIGAAMRESWEAKRKLASGVSNDQIDVAVTRALDAGASGAKLTGAGGGGFLLVICPIERQRAVRESLRGHAGIAGGAGPPGLAYRAQRAARHLELSRV